MFLGVLYTILGAINPITYKKACAYAENFMNAGLILIIAGQLVEFPLYFIADFFLPSHLGLHFGLENISLPLIAAFVLIFSVAFISNFISQYVYANEKISVLSPYAQLGGIFTVVFGILFPFARGDTSTWTIVIAVITGLTILIASIDFKHLTFNRFCALLALNGLLGAIVSITIVWLLMELTPLTVMAINGTSLLIGSLIYLAIRGIVLPVRDIRFYTLGKYQFISNSIWVVRELSFYVVLASIGMLAATLLGMAQFAVTLVLAYFMFHDIPSKKDLTLSIVVISSVGLGLLGNYL